MPHKPPENLSQLVAGSSVSDALGWDLAGGVVIGVAVGWWSWSHFAAVQAAADPVGNIVGAVLGVAVGAAALVAAFMDQEFLRKVKMIRRDPVRYVAPFLLTAALAVVAASALLLLTLLSPGAPRGVLAVVSGVAFGLTIWTYLSVLRCVSSLVGFVRLQSVAAEMDAKVTDIRKPPNQTSAGSE